VVEDLFEGSEDCTPIPVTFLNMFNNRHPKQFRVCGFRVLEFRILGFKGFRVLGF
jgi:hypothetical protein